MQCGDIHMIIQDSAKKAALSHCKTVLQADNLPEKIVPGRIIHQ